MRYTYTAKSILLIISLWAIGASAQTSRKTSRIDKNLNIYADVLRQLDMNYVDTLNYEDLLETGVNQMLQRIDPYTVYIPKREDDNLKLMTTGKYGGIGAIIVQRDSAVYISEPYEGMPAQLHNVLAGDKILEVDGQKCKGKTTKEVSDLLRGKAETMVRLKLEREGEEKPIVREFARKEIHMPSVDYYSVMDNIGYLCFSEFTAGSARDFLLAAYDMVNNSNIQGLVVDLRGNGGGIIDEAIQIVSYFVDKGTEVVSTKGKTQSSNRSYKTNSSPLFKELPLVILVNNQSASASEIVSGSLQDLGRAKLIGQRTFGKGLVQSIRPVAFEGHLKVTTARYYLPSGRCIQAIDYSDLQKGKKLQKDTAGGILPDILMTDSTKVDICYSLYIQHMFFDYATRYHATHDSIDSPLTFTLTDEDIKDFCEFLKTKNFKYETETSKYFREVLNVAHHEDIDSTVIAEMEALQCKLTPSFQEAIMRNIESIKQTLGAEIVTRYFFQKGRIAYLLRFDPEIKRAIEEIHNMTGK